MTPLPTHTQSPKSWGNVDFKMPTDENALTQTKFELGISGIIHNVFQGDQTTRRNFFKIVGNKLIIFHGKVGGGVHLHGKFHGNIFFFLKPCLREGLKKTKKRLDLSNAHLTPASQAERCIKKSKITQFF